MKPNSKRIIFASACLVFLLAANFSFARGLVNCGETTSPTGQIDTSKMCKIGDLIFTIKRLINFLLSWAWLVAVAFIAWAGWDLVNAGGNPQAIAKGKAGLSNAIIGFFLVLTSFLLLNTIIYILTGSDLDLRELFSFLP